MARDEKRHGLIPGTEILFTAENSNPQVGHEGSTSAKGLRLVPEPSTAPDDPLNWSPLWKAAVVGNQAVFVFVSIMTPLAIAPLTPIFMAEFDKTLPQVNLLFGVAAITLGYANFAIVPAANAIGRRPVLLVCGLLCMAADGWSAAVTSYPSFIGARVLSGIGAAANESIMPMVIADTLFLHQRGLWMGVYFWAYFIGLFLGPIVAGNCAAALGWRWFFWICLILQATSLIATVFLFPETRYDRYGTSTSASVTIQSGHGSLSDSDENAPKTPAAAISAIEIGATNANWAISEHGESRGHPSKAQFSVVPHRRAGRGWAAVVRDTIAPLQIFAFPIVLWASLSMGFAANCLLALNLTQAQVFGPPPYLFNAAQIGYVNFAFVGGAIVGLLSAGPVSDWVSMRAARRNGGVREAEMRLVALVPFIAICLVGMVVAAVGYQYLWPWEAIVIAGYGLVGVEVVAIPAIVISYAVDCYKHLPGEIMISATVVKNTFGFGMIFFFNDWAVTQGFIPPVMTMMALCVGFSLVGLVVFLKWGKQFRTWTKDSKLHTL